MHAKSKFVTQLVVHVLVMVEVISEYRDQFRVPTPSQLVNILLSFLIPSITG